MYLFKKPTIQLFNSRWKLTLSVLFISTVILSFFQNCGRWEARDLYSETPKRFGFSQIWSEAILYKGHPYRSQETVFASSYKFYAPIIDTKSGQISYVGYFGDGSWQVVNLPDGTPRSRKIVLSSETVPGYSIQGLEFLSEKSIFVVFLLDLRSPSPQQNHKLLAISTDGSQSWIIAERVLKAEISEDGNRVNYTAIDQQNLYGSKVLTSLIVSPNPHSLGTIDWQSTGSPYLSKSSSSASNTPVFYLQNRFVDENQTTRVYYAKRFGKLSGNSLPESFRVHSYLSHKDFEDFRLSKHGKMLTSRYSWGNFIDAKGIEHPRGEALMSPDGTLVAYKNALGETAVYNEDGSSTLVPDSGGRIGPWSKDSRYVFIGTNTKWIIFDTKANSRVNGTQPGSNFRDEVVDLIGQNRLLLWKTFDQNYHVKYKITALDGSNGITLNQGNNLSGTPSLFADTNNGIIFSDDWGLYFTNYDGSGRTRLDHPRANETNQVPKDSNVANPFGLLVWDAPRSRLIFQPSLYLFNSSHSPIRSLSVLSADKSITRLTTDSKQVNQIPYYQVYEDLNIIAFNSSDLSRTISHSGPGPIPLIGSLDGGPSTSLSPKNFNSPNSFTLKEYPKRSPALAKVDNTIKYLHSFEPSSAFESLSSWGISPLSLTGEYVSLSPDKKWALSLSYPPFQAHLTRISSLKQEEPILISSNIDLDAPTICFGCGDSNTWSLQGYSVAKFINESKIILKSKTSFFLVDTNNLDNAPVDLGITNYAILGNSASIVGVDLQNNLVSIDLDSPNQKIDLGKKQFIGALGNSVLLASNTAGSSYLYSSLNFLDLNSATTINLIPSALPPGSINSSSPILSNDQKMIFYKFQEGNKYGLENTYYVTLGLDGSPHMIFKHSGSGWGDFFPSENRNIKASADLQNLYFTQKGRLMHLHKNNGWIPKAITPESYRVTSFTIGLKKLIIVAETENNEKMIIVSNMDGSGSRILVEPMPANKLTFDFRFIKNEKSILFLTDAAEDRVIALTRIDLE